MRSVASSAASVSLEQRSARLSGCFLMRAMAARVLRGRPVDRQLTDARLDIVAGSAAQGRRGEAPGGFADGDDALRGMGCGLVLTLAERGIALEQVVEDQLEVALGRRGELNPVPHGSVACA
jgi:hypothetical protein